MLAPLRHRGAGGAVLAIAHFNLARLRAVPGDSLVAEFVDNTPAVNAVAEAAPGFIWRWSDDSGKVSAEAAYEGIDGDPLLAASMSVWESAAALGAFVFRGPHGSYLRRRAEWFEPNVGANYVIWPCGREERPTVDEGMARLARLRSNGPGPEHMDFATAMRQP
jgi:hypothetical protein